MAETSASQRCVCLTISGRVQGVGYRVWTQKEATVRGLVGWVRNRANGDVEAFVCGPVEIVQAFIEICRGGPPSARVDHILVEETEPDAQGVADAFVTLPTI